MVNVSLTVFAASLSLAQGAFARYGRDGREWTWADPLPASPELASLGNYEVGYQQIQYTRPFQFDFSTNTFGDRPLNLGVWYPIKDGRGSRKCTITYSFFAPYLDTTVSYRGIARPETPFSKYFKTHLFQEGEKSFPLMVISHGFPGKHELASGMAENFASKGYVVVAIDHTDSLETEETTNFIASVFHRRGDILDTIQHISDLVEAESFLNGVIDVDNTVLVGYSTGAFGVEMASGSSLDANMLRLVVGEQAFPLFSSLTVPVSDPRIKATASFAPFGNGLANGIPPLFNLTSHAQINIPTIKFSGVEDDIVGLKSTLDLYGATTAKKYLVTYEQARHNIILNGVPEDFYDIPGASYEAVERYDEFVWNKAYLVSIGHHFMTAFFNVVLHNDDSAEEYFVAENGVYKSFFPRASFGFSVVSEN